MKNKKSMKTLLLSVSFTAVFVVLIIAGELYCDWARYLTPIALIPTAIWSIKNWKNFSFKKDKNINK